MHKKVKEAAGFIGLVIMRDYKIKIVKLLLDKCEKMYTWNDYIEGLFEDVNRSEDRPEFESSNSLPIMMEESKRQYHISKMTNP